MDALRWRYRHQKIERLKQLPPALIKSLVAAGLIEPTRGRRNELHFSFGDLTLLRTAAALLEAKIPLRRMMKVLTKLRAQHPASMPLTGISLSAVGADVVVRQGDSQWTAESGQLLLDFEGLRSGEVRGMATAHLASTADEWFQRASELEPSDAAAAESAYRQALSLDCGHVNAYLNLGAMLCEAQRWSEAAELYAEAIRCCPDEPVLHFNQGVVLENLGHTGKALRSYERCLSKKADFADAHYNLARLLEVMGDAQGAIRHLSAYRRATRAD